METVNLIVAVGRDGAIGRRGDLIWNLPGDLKRFKELTTGHPVIMGRKTWESLPKKPLPGRKNIVITRNKNYKADGAELVGSIEDALKITKGENPFIIGGAEIYRISMPFVTNLYLTEVDADTPDADAWLHLDKTCWKEIETGETLTASSGITFRYCNYRRL